MTNQISTHKVEEEKVKDKLFTYLANKNKTSNKEENETKQKRRKNLKKRKGVVVVDVMKTRVYETPSRTRSWSGCAKTKPIKGEQHEEGAGILEKEGRTTRKKTKQKQNKNKNKNRKDS